MIRLDFTPEVVGLSSQPFWLSWDDGARGRRHAPDYFARLSDGAARRGEHRRPARKLDRLTSAVGACHDEVNVAAIDR